MPTSSKTAIYAAISAVLSIGIHSLLVLLGGQLQVSFLPSLDKEPGEPDSQRKIQLRSVDLSSRVFRTDDRSEQGKEAAQAAELASLFKQRREVDDIFKNEGMMDSDDRFTPGEVPETVRDDPEIPETQDDRLSESVIDEELQALRPEILKTDTDSLPDSRLQDDRYYIAEQERRQIDERLLDSLAGTGDGTGDTGGDAADGGSGGVAFDNGGDGADVFLPSGEHPEDSAADTDEEAAAPVPSGMPTEMLAEQEAEAAEGEGEQQDEGEAEERSIDALLDASMTVFEDTRGEEMFFRIDIETNPRAESLQAIDKDVLFLIDSSTSISVQMLNVFKRTASRALTYLNTADRFNVVNFRETPKSLFEDYRPVEEKTIAEARSYLRHVSRYGKTDVYAGLAPFVGKEEREERRPLTVFLLTDGQSTAPNKLDDQTLLRRIDKSNRRQVSIYAASFGGRINRYLLDLLAYTNKGYHLYREDLGEFEKTLLDYVRSHSTIVAADLEYTATGKIDREMYPESLPHLYRNGTLSVYGKLPDDTDEFALQIRGWSAGEDRLNYVYHADIDKAEKGSAELKKDWIAQKAFYLIAKEALQPTEAVKREIREFQRKYSPDIPYFR